jgi:hypothetical protein
MEFAGTMLLSSFYPPGESGSPRRLPAGSSHYDVETNSLSGRTTAVSGPP